MLLGVNKKLHLKAFRLITKQCVLQIENNEPLGMRSITM
jgi:hypothetical protein